MYTRFHSKTKLQGSPALPTQVEKICTRTRLPKSETCHRA